MEQKQTRPQIWEVVTALATAAAAFCALGIVLLLRQQIGQSTRDSRFAVGVEAQWKLLQQWDTPLMTRTRSRAAKELLTNHPGRNVDQVLDFFEIVSMLINRDILDDEIAWVDFNYWIDDYWTASQDYVRRVQHEEGGATWGELTKAMPRLEAVDARHNHQPRYTPPTKDDINAFLEDEARLVK